MLKELEKLEDAGRIHETPVLRFASTFHLTYSQATGPGP